MLNILHTLLTSFCVIQHPQRGKIKFKLYPYQYDVLDEYAENDYNVILKVSSVGYIYPNACLLIMDDVV